MSMLWHVKVTYGCHLLVSESCHSFFVFFVYYLCSSRISTLCYDPYFIYDFNIKWVGKFLFLAFVSHLLLILIISISIK
jgi:hypothetical protein